MNETTSRLLDQRLVLAAAAALALGALAPAGASVITYAANLNGPSESPPNASPGIGITTVVVDTVANTMHVHLDFSGLVAPTTASHIHAATAVPGVGTAGVATQTPSFVGFPLGVTSGTFDNTLDMTLASSYNPAYITANGGTPASAEAALFQAIADGRSYLNIHSTSFPSGEIRGFLTPIPGPGAAAMLGLGVLVSLRRRR
jgi:uncharacterized protein (TIGR03382 family)